MRHKLSYIIQGVFFLFINVNVQDSLHAPRLILRILKLTIM
jgi:hypothetical protein